MENQNNNLQELEQLRSQVAEFKNRLEQQEIVSRQMLEEAMKGHVSWIKQMSVWGGVVDLALVPLIVYLLKSIVVAANHYHRYSNGFRGIFQFLECQYHP